MDGIKEEMDLKEQFQFKRIPITSEAFPEFSDRKLTPSFSSRRSELKMPFLSVRDILETVTNASPEDALIVNDQLGLFLKYLCLLVFPC